MRPFFERFSSLGDDLSPFCLGLDPSRATLEAAGLNDDVEGLQTFCEGMLKAVNGLTSMIKPQMAYFERKGPDGLKVLQRVGDMARERGLLLLLDGKRGDIGTTCEGYADAFFGPDSPYRADAVTVSPYLGFGALEPILEAAADNGAGIFVVVLSSNPEGRVIQTARVEETGLTVAETLAGEINAFNEAKGTKVVGAVLGATLGVEMAPIVRALDGGLVLTPGIGHQGASFDDLEDAFEGHRRSLVPTMSRSIVAAGFSENVLRNSVANAAIQAARFRTKEDAADMRLERRA